MQEGGLIASTTSIGWVPLAQFQKKGVERLVYTGYRTLGKSNYLLNQTRVPGAWYCETCHTVTGTFEVTNKDVWRKEP